MNLEDPCSYQLPIPASADEFEEICLEIWKEVWADPDIQRLGRSGQGQYGIDILSNSSDNAVKNRVIQCKNYRRTKLTTKIIGSIVDEVRKSPLMPISKLVIATTAPRDGKTQTYVNEIMQKNRDEGLFDVVIYSWDDIQSLLGKYPEILKRHYPSYFRVSSTGSVVIGNDALLDEVKDEIKERKFAEALRMIDRFVKRQLVLDDNTKYRVLTNKGVILARTGKITDAVDPLFQAYLLNRTGEFAGANAAQAYLAIGAHSDAVRIAKEVIATNPANTLAYKILIFASPGLARAKSVMNKAPAIVKASGDALLAIGMVSASESDFDSAERYLRAALESYGHEDAITCAQLGAVIMTKLQNATQYDPELMRTSESKAVVGEAHRLLSAAIVDSNDMSNEFLYWCYSTRCRARLWLGDTAGAEQDAETCIIAVPEEPVYKKLLASVRYERKNIDGAIEILQSIRDYHTVPDALDMLASLLEMQGRFDEALRATVEFLGLPEKPPIPDILAKHLQVRLLLSLKKVPDARACVEKLRNGDPDNPLWITDLCSCMRAEGVGNSDPRLQDLLGQAASLTTSKTPALVRDEVSTTMSSFSRYDLCASVDCLGVRKDCYDARARRLLQGYLHCGRYVEVKSMCDALVEAGVRDGEVYWYRAQLYVRSDDLTAAEADLRMCMEFAGQDRPDDHLYAEICLQLAEVQLHNNHSDDALKSVLIVSNLPCTTPSQFDRLISLWLALREYACALHAAYERRFHPEYGMVAETYKTYVRCFLTIERLSPTSLEQEKTVGLESGVLVKFDFGEQTWYIADDTKRPRMGNVAFLQPDDALWLSLQGKASEDTITRTDPSAITTNKAANGAWQNATIIRVTSRYAVMFSECFTSYVLQFPDRNELQQIPLTDTSDSTEISESFRKCIADTAEFGARVRRILAAQSDGRIPLSQVSCLLARNPVELVQELAAAQNEYFYAALPGTPPKSHDDSVTALVLDPLTALTLSRLSAFGEGPPETWSVTYTSMTMDVLMDASLELKASSASGLESLVSIDGKHFTLAKVSPDTVHQRLAEVEHTIAWLEKYAVVTPCNLILQYGEDKYQQAATVIGRAEVEAIALATEPFHVLVSDEFVLRKLSGSEKATAVSTQDVLRWMVETNCLSSNDYGSNLLQLYRDHMRGVYFDVDTIVAICGSVDWDAQRLPSGLFGILAAVNSGDAGPQIAGQLACKIYMKVTDPSTRSKAWWPMLLSAVADGRKASQAFSIMVYYMDIGLHLVVPAVQELRSVASIWLKTSIAN